MSFAFYALCVTLIVIDTVLHVLIQMHFEGHEAFNDPGDPR